MRLTRSRTDRGAGALACAILLTQIGCNEPLAAPLPANGSDDATPRRGGTVRLASFGDIHVLDPAVSAGGLEYGPLEILYAGLVDYDANGNIIPDLASRFEITEDGLVYRFFLRENARFHDGDEVTADDVRRSIERALHPSTPNPWSTFYASIAGYRDYIEKRAAHLSGVSVDGRYVVSIRLAERDARFLALLAMMNLRPVCKSAGERYDDTWVACGAGPFRLGPGGWDRGRSLTLTRHDAYFRPGLPYLDTVSWTYSMNIGSERFRFEAGDLDIIRDLTQADEPRFQHDPRWKPYGEYEPDRTVNGESMNTEMPPFDNVEVRRAVASGINREHFRLIRPSAIHTASQVLPPGIPGYDPTFRGQEYDYPAALEHMRRAGYPYDPETGKGGYEPTIPYYVYPQGLPAFTAQLLQQDLGKIGLRLAIRTVNFPAWVAITFREKTVQISPQGWQEDYPDPSDFFESLFSSKSINPEQSTNTSFYRSTRVDDLIDRARRELDTASRYALYGEANRIVCDDAPWAFTHNYRFYIVHQPYVRDYRPHPVWPEYLPKVWVDHGSSEARTASWRSLTSPPGERP